MGQSAVRSYCKRLAGQSHNALWAYAARNMLGSNKITSDALDGKLRGCPLHWWLGTAVVLVWVCLFIFLKTYTFSS